jgi:hypothetical protein
MCTQAIVPGYRVVLAANGQQYEYHTNEAGSIVVQVPLTQVQPEEPAAVIAARRALASQLGVDFNLVQAIHIEPVQWQDSCLGLGGPAESCLQAATPGYRILLVAKGNRYEFHTDADGQTVRAVTADSEQPGADVTAAPTPAAAGPTPLPGDTPVAAATPLVGTVIEWQGTTASGCRAASIGADGVTYGPCGGAQVTGKLLAEMDRPAQLAALVRDYEAFSVSTPAGKVKLSGQGKIVATLAEQQMIAEWAAQVAQEAQTGSSGATAGLALQWHREGGIAGFCDDLSIYRYGFAYATNCKGSAIQMLGGRRLTGDELTTLFTQLNNLASFQETKKDAATADAMTIGIMFAGQGATQPTDQDKADLNQFASEILARWANATPVQTVHAQADVTIFGGPAETYPKLGQVFAGQSALVTGVNRDSTWWRVVCPDETLGNCWVTGDARMIQPVVPPGSTGLAPVDETGIYSAVIRQVYTVDHTFGQAPNFSHVYLLRTDDVEAGAMPFASRPGTVAAPTQQAIIAALSDLPTTWTWISNIDEVPLDDSGSVAQNGAIISLGNIRAQPDGKVHVATSLYVGRLAAGGQTYVVEKVNGTWKVTGKTGPSWIS